MRAKNPIAVWRTAVKFWIEKSVGDWEEEVLFDGRAFVWWKSGTGKVLYTWGALTLILLGAMVHISLSSPMTPKNTAKISIKWMPQSYTR
jgi:hypothetical protein